MRKVKTFLLSKKIILATGLFVAIFLVSPAPVTSNAAAATPTDSQIQTKLNSNPLVKDLRVIVNALSAGVAIIVIAVIIIGGIQYSLAGDNSQAITAARQRIINGLIALVTFILIYAFLQWLIPGGAFS